MSTINILYKEGGCDTGCRYELGRSTNIDDVIAVKEALTKISASRYTIVCESPLTFEQPEEVS